jgi:SPP1 family predicted phage head-tail adaptor
MFDASITLKAVTPTQNTYGDELETIVEKEMFARVKSVGMKEKYLAMEQGLNPEIVFVISDYLDYGNQEFVEHENVTYKVMRTFRSGKELEIVCQRTGNLGTAKLSTATGTFSKANPIDVVTYVSQGTVSAISKGGTDISTTAYALKYQRVTFDSDYLATLTNGANAFVIKTDNGNLNFTITVAA